MEGGGGRGGEGMWRRGLGRMGVYMRKCGGGILNELASAGTNEGYDREGWPVSREDSEGSWKREIKKRMRRKAEGCKITKKRRSSAAVEREGG